MKKILGMGNALTDILLQIDNDDILFSLNLPKGGMQLIDSTLSDQISEVIAPFPTFMATGGSASNTINGLSRLGLTTGFFGKVGKDEVGKFFIDDSLANGVTPHLLESVSSSGRCIVLVSPDSERTMCTFLGAACELQPEDIKPELFSGYDIFHIEGYLVQNHELIRRAVKLAKEANLLVSIDLASYNVVEANLAFLKEIVSDYVDLVFANEDEARAFTSAEPEDAIISLSEHCDIAVVKIGKDGSFVKSKEEQVRIQPRLANAIDTTGAGDLYAAGFLYGLANGLNLHLCGSIGSLVSSKVVEVLGAKMSDETWTDILAEIRELEN